MDEHTYYYVAHAGTYGADVPTGPFGTRAEAAAVCRRYGGARGGRAPRPQPTSPVRSGPATAGGAAGGAGARSVYAVVGGAELQERHGHAAASTGGEACG